MAESPVPQEVELTERLKRFSPERQAQMKAVIAQARQLAADMKKASRVGKIETALRTATEEVRLIEDEKEVYRRSLEAIISANDLEEAKIIALMGLGRVVVRTS